MKTIKIILFLPVLILLLAMPQQAYAQKLEASLNLGDALLLGTVGVEANYALSQHWSAGATVRVNPWTFNASAVDPQMQSQLRQQSYALGVRWWPWYVYSGVWAGVKAQYQEYNRGGFGGRLSTEEGDAFGASVEVGYSWMLSHQLNLNLGVSGWGGVTKYVSYSCPRCGRIVEKGVKPFLLPNEIIIAIAYIF